MPPGSTGRDGDRICELTTEYAPEPKNVAPGRPRFSWRVDTDRRQAAQTAYQLRVGRSRDALVSGEDLIWDSGWVDCERATSIRYAGVNLDSETTYYWTVRIRDETGAETDWATPAAFRTGVGGQGNWAGEWISHQPNGGDSSGYRSRWGSGEQEWIQLDFGAPVSIDRIELIPTTPVADLKTPDGFAVSAGYAQEGRESRFRGATGFGFPNRYRIEIADNPEFTGAETLIDRTGEAHPNPGVDPVEHSVTATGQYLRVIATTPYRFDPADPPTGSPHHKVEYIRETYESWTVFALAGIRVLSSDGTDEARDATVTASSSIESETWGVDHLVTKDDSPRVAEPSPLLRTEFTLDADIREAWVHVCALGYGELMVNGDRIGDAVLDPGWTQYDDHALYRTYEVSESLDQGPNAIGLWLGRGWFSKHVGHWRGNGSPRAILKLTLELSDGTTKTVRSGSHWRAHSSPIRANDIYDGEVYDASAEQPGWAEPGFDDSNWTAAVEVSPPGGELVPQRTQPIRVTDTLEPDRIIDHENGPIIDFGQNLVGWVHLDVSEAEAGDRITIRHAETRRNDGRLNTADLRTAEATDTYIAAADAATDYEPRFTYHGFRYAQVENYPGTLTADDITAKVVHSDLEQTGRFVCSNETLNQVQHNAEWGLRGNIHSIPTDCPQRDERLGWTGDGHIAARALLYNFDAVRFHEKWLADHEAQQSPHGYIADTIPFAFGTVPEERTWGITQITIPWHLYHHSGDVGILESQYEEMRRYIEFWHGESTDGFLGPEYGNYGDWLAFEATDGRKGLPFELYNTAFHYYTLTRMARIAEILGQEADADRYETLAATTQETFTDRFYDVETASYGPGTQSSFAVPLFVDIVPAAEEQRVADALAEKVNADGRQLRTGFLGTRPLVHVLPKYGYADLAYELVCQPEQPGWVYMVEEGATTMWERWDSNERIGDGMNSFNHSPLTFISEWFFAVIAGIDFGTSVRDLRITPRVVEDLSWASGRIETVNGPVATRWDRSTDQLDLSVTIPWNSTASVSIPDLGADAICVTETDTQIWAAGEQDSQPPGVSSVTRTEDRLTLSVDAGEYEFRVQPLRE